MIASLGVEYVILGHSERREYYGETSATLNKKMVQAYENNLIPIYCVGEKLEERENGKYFDVVRAQIEEVVFNLTPEQFSKLIIAYEPVWAIGTGKTATAEQAQEIHAFIRKVLAEKFGDAAANTVILYGGSCQTEQRCRTFRQGRRRRRPDRRRRFGSVRLYRHRQRFFEIICYRISNKGAAVSKPAALVFSAKLAYLSAVTILISEWKLS